MTSFTIIHKIDPENKSGQSANKRQLITQSDKI